MEKSCFWLVVCALLTGHRTLNTYRPTELFNSTTITQERYLKSKKYMCFILWQLVKQFERQTAITNVLLIFNETRLTKYCDGVLNVW